MSQIQNMQIKNSTKQNANTSVPSIIRRQSVAGAIRKFRCPLNMEMTGNAHINTSKSAIKSNTGGISRILQNHKQLKALTKANVPFSAPITSILGVHGEMNPSKNPLASQKVHSPKIGHIPKDSQPQVTLLNDASAHAIVSPRSSHPGSSQNDHLSIQGTSRNMQSLPAQNEENATHVMMTTTYEDHKQRTTPASQSVEMESHPRSIASLSNRVSNEGFSTTLGNFVRNQCPIFYENWRKVPYEYKERVLNLMKKEGFQIPDQCAQKVINLMDKPWRSFKYRLRNLHYDKYDTVVSKKRNCPSGVRQEDWEIFVDMQLDADYKRAHGKKARSCVKLRHTSDRRGTARTIENLKAENSSEIVTRTDLFLATHCGKDGIALTPEANEQLQQIQAMVRGNPSSTSLDVDHDPVAQVCGLDGKGSVRGMDAGVTKTALRSSAPARYKLQEETTKHCSLEVKINTQGVVIEELKNLLANQGKMIADLQERFVSQSPHSRVSNDPITSRVGEAENVHTPPTSIVNSSSPNLAIEQTCELLSFGGDVVAYGRMLSKRPAIDGVCNTEVYKVVIDVIQEPNAPLYKKEGTSSTLKHVGEGSTIIWPKIFTRLL